MLRMSLVALHLWLSLFLDPIKSYDEIGTFAPLALSFKSYDELGTHCSYIFAPLAFSTGRSQRLCTSGVIINATKNHAVALHPCCIYRIRRAGIVVFYPCIS